jgi:hypothetical protein
MPDATTPAIVAGLIGLVLPLVVAFARRPDTGPKVAYALALGSSVVAGLLVALVSGDMQSITPSAWASDPAALIDGIKSIATDICICATATQSAYALYWRTTGTLERLEKAP